MRSKSKSKSRTVQIFYMGYTVCAQETVSGYLVIVMAFTDLIGNVLVTHTTRFKAVNRRTTNRQVNGVQQCDC